MDYFIFQGPSLLAYNDAGFSKKDLIGIRMLQTSVKSEDALKVGRFGLGFKSVFHMTGQSVVVIVVIATGKGGAPRY